MALAMSYVNEVLRQFSTTVIINHDDWPGLMRLFKLSENLPSCVLDRMTLHPVVGGYEGLLQRLGEAQAENDELRDAIKELERKQEPVVLPISNE